MTAEEEAAVAAVEAQILGEHGVLRRLGRKEGLREADAHALESALLDAIEVFRDRDAVPKRLAGLFVELVPAFERCMPAYPEDVQDRIFDLSARVVQLAGELFAVD
jgi:hypothetical protein